MTKCKLCDGAGKVVLLAGWLVDARDRQNFRREKCGRCGGTGHSTYRWPEHERVQKRLRRLVAKAT